jgi:hypothetical protein
MIARRTAWRNLGLATGLLLTAPLATEAGTQTITAESLREHVGYLAADERGGRDTGTTGCAEAEQYIGDHFSSFGLDHPPRSDDHYLSYILYRQGYDTATSRLVVGSGPMERIGSGFRPFPFSAEGDIAARVVFAGYGVTAPQHDYDDYADLDVADQIVIVLRREPQPDDENSVFGGADNTDHATFRAKADLAYANDAAALLVVSDPAHPTSTDDLRADGRLRIEQNSESTDEPSDEDETSIVAVHINRETGYDLLEALTGLEPAELQRALDAGEVHPRDFVDRQPVFGRLSVHEEDEPDVVLTRNVCGILEGSDPNLRHEFVVVGAHHDHVGSFVGTGDNVFNGADDNASGTAAVIELARAFAENPVPPRRSLIFATFSGEERGLLGSQVMVDEKQIPVENTVFMLNLDMIGRNPDEPIEVSGDGVARGLHDLVVAANDAVEVNVEYLGKEFGRNTDHVAFYDAGIPFITFFSGFHDDYHQLGDHPEKLAYDRMVDVTRFAYEIVSYVANADEAPSLIHDIAWLGLEFEQLEGPEIVGVEANSRAARVGFRLGDRMVKVGADEISSAREASALLQEIEPGTATTLSVRREGGLVTFDVARAKRGFLGIQPRPLSDERRQEMRLTQDEGVLVQGLVAGGPSESAGIEAGDVIVSLDGRPVTSTRLFAILSQIGAGETVNARIVRGEDRLTIPITLGERRRR